MALARFKDLIFDATDPARLGPFWAQVLRREWVPDPGQPVGAGRLVGPTPQHTVWIEPVPEAKTVKNRVHVDVWTRAVADLQAIGASVVRAQDDDIRWTVLADPDGGEFCAFLRPDL